MRRVSTTLALACALLVASGAFAEQKVFKYDDWQGTIEENADGKNKHPHKAYPGFIQGEAYGQIYRPAANEYPVKITAIKMVVASPPNIMPPGSVNIDIEIWNDTSQTVEPNIAAPTFKIGSSEFWNPAKGQPNMPLTGNSAMVYKFDYADPQGHPPIITQGNIRVVVRFKSPAEDLATYWGDIGCTKMEIQGVTLGCGCEKVAVLTDTSTTPKSNFVQIITPLGQCSGGMKWLWIEDVQTQGKTMSGDFILRMETETSGVAPPADAGPAVDAGQPDAGGAAADTTTPQPDAGSVDQGVAPVLNPEVSLVTPKEIVEGEISPVEIIGNFFEKGAAVKVGKYAMQVVSVTPKKITANVMPGPKPGSYAVIVENPSGGIGFKDNALTVIVQPEPDAGETDAGPADAGAPDVSEPDTGPEDVQKPAALKPEIEIVTPDNGPADKEVEVTIVGKHFEEGAVVKIGSTKLLVLSVKPTSISAKVLPPMTPGMHTVLVENPSGQVGFKEKAYTVLAAAVADAGPVDGGSATVVTASPADDGCSAGGNPARPGSLAGWLALTALALLWRRRLGSSR